MLDSHCNDRSRFASQQRGAVAGIASAVNLVTGVGIVIQLAVEHANVGALGQGVVVADGPHLGAGIGFAVDVVSLGEACQDGVVAELVADRDLPCITLSVTTGYANTFNRRTVELGANLQAERESVGTRQTQGFFIANGRLAFKRMLPVSQVCEDRTVAVVTSQEVAFALAVVGDGRSCCLPRRPDWWSSLR